MAKQSKRGGKRPGAGAPAGNTNAKKHGLWSDLVDGEMLREVDLLEAIDPAERRRMHLALREVRILRAAKNAETPLDALNRGWGAILEHLSKVEEVARGDDFDAALDELEAREGVAPGGEDSEVEDDA